MHPIVKPLSLWRRKLVFGTLFLAFLFSLPAFIFYATGYRYDFSADRPTFTATGGFYIFADAPENTIYVDDELVDNIRSFRSASYLQGVETGLHNLHVQAPGVHTWVKELTVLPHIVTEAEAFNLPIVPQVRLIMEYNNSASFPVVSAKSTSSPVFAIASTTNSYVVSTSTATSSYTLNPEFALIKSLFVEQASTTAEREKLLAQSKQKGFGFSTTSVETESASLALATTTVSRDTITLLKRDEDVFAKATPSNFRSVPHYFCAPRLTEEVIGEDREVEVLTAESVVVEEATLSGIPCRDEIKIDRKGQEVISFNFFPKNGNLVLMHLTDGVYVTEIDDRSWQNTQLLYPGENIQVLIYRGGVFIKENDVYFEVLSEIIGA